MGKTLFEKIWDQHVVTELPGGEVLLYIDRHLIHEVTSPQAFEGLKLNKRPVRHPELTFATTDHNVPTDSRTKITDPVARTQVNALESNCAEHGIRFYGMNSEKQGVVHIIGPEQGITLPGTTIVCGDSHTATHGGFGSIAFGIGTSEVEHVLATQTLRQKKPMQYRVEFTGNLPIGITAKDLVLELIGRIGAAGGTGCAFEFCGSAIEQLSMEGRLTVCNMAIEGARAVGSSPPTKLPSTISLQKIAPLPPKVKNSTQPLTIGKPSTQMKMRFLISRSPLTSKKWSLSLAGAPVPAWSLASTERFLNWMDQMYIAPKTFRQPSTIWDSNLAPA